MDADHDLLQVTIGQLELPQSNRLARQRLYVEKKLQQILPLKKIKVLSKSFSSHVTIEYLSLAVEEKVEQLTDLTEAGAK